MILIILGIVFIVMALVIAYMLIMFEIVAKEMEEFD